MTSSAVRPLPSRTRTRPESAARAASRPTDRSPGGRPRNRPSDVATSTMSMAPRTDEPIRSSGWARVSRTSSTTLATHAASARRLTGRPGHHRRLLGGVLVVHQQAARPVVHGRGDPGRPHGVERVHGGHQAEAGRGLDMSEPRHAQLALAHHGDEDVERLLRDAVDLLDVQQRAVPQRLEQRAVDEDLRAVALGEHPRRVEVPDEARRRQLGVALDEGEADAQLVGDRPEQGRLARTRRPLQQDVAAGGRARRRRSPAPAGGRPHGGGAGRGGRPRSARQSKTITPRMFSPSRMAW